MTYFPIVKEENIENGAVTLGKLPNGVFTADAAGRAKFTDDFINAALLAHDIDASGIGFISAISKRIVAEFTAGVNLTANQVVYISAAGQVSPALMTNASQMIGVTDDSATAGNSVDVTTFGKINVVANSVINAGSLLIASGVVAGRVTALLGHLHSNPNTGSGGLHTHTNPSTSSTGSHTHTNPSTSSTGSHRHSFNLWSYSAGSHYHTGGVNAAGAHTHTNPTTSGPSTTDMYIHNLVYGSSCAVGKCVSSVHEDYAAAYDHTHTQGATGSAGSHGHDFWTTYAGTHSHQIEGNTAYDGTHSHTQGSTGSAGTHSHTQGSTGSAGTHSHTQGSTGLASNGVVVGKAITAAAGAGDTIEAYICLSG